MRQVRNVFVLGAGAIAAFGYPLGRQLLDDILGLNPSRINAALRDDQKNYAEFADALRHSGAYSVDLFLERNDHFMDVGKKAIAKALIAHERPEALWWGRNPQSGKPNSQRPHR